MSNNQKDCRENPTLPFVLVAALGFILLILASCSAQKEVQKTTVQGIKIGVLAPLTGAVPTCGENMDMGLHLALARLNQTRDASLNPIIEDTQFKPAVAVTAAQKLLDVDKVRFLIGDCGSSGTLAVAPLAEERKAILFTPISFADKISDAGDFVFRFATTAGDEVPLMIPFISNQLGAKKVAVIYLNNDYGLSFKQRFSEEFEQQGGQIVEAEAADPPETDFRTVLLKIQAKKAEVLLLPTTLPQLITIVKQAREIGLDIKFVSTQVAEHETLLKAIGDVAQNRLFFSSLVDLSDDALQKNPEAKVFLELFRDKYPDRIPSTEIIETYDTLLLLAKSLHTCGENPHCVRDDLYSTSTFNGASGESYVDWKGDVKHKNIVFKTVRDGRFVKME